MLALCILCPIFRVLRLYVSLKSYPLYLRRIVRETLLLKVQYTNLIPQRSRMETRKIRLSHPFVIFPTLKSKKFYRWKPETLFLRWIMRVQANYHSTKIVHLVCKMNYLFFQAELKALHHSKGNFRQIWLFENKLTWI